MDNFTDTFSSSVQSAPPAAAGFKETVINTFNSLFEFIANIWDSIASLFLDIFIWLFNYILAFAAHLIDLLASSFPSLDFGVDFLSGMSSLTSEVICLMNWVIPFDVVNGCLIFYIGMVGFYFTFGFILRWGKITN